METPYDHISFDPSLSPREVFLEGYRTALSRSAVDKDLIATTLVSCLLSGYQACVERIYALGIRVGSVESGEVG